MYNPKQEVSTGRIDSTSVKEDTEDNSSESSFVSSFSDTESPLPDWESSVDETTGEVFYIKCYPTEVLDLTDVETELEDIVSNNPNIHCTKGRYSKLLGLHKNEKFGRRKIKTSEFDISTASKVGSQDSHENEEREVTLRIHPVIEDGPNLIEQVLGISVGTLLDGARLMVTGFPCDSYGRFEKNIKIGDWLKSINGISVNHQNINTVLQQLTDKSEVLIRIQKEAEADLIQDHLSNDLNFVRQMTAFNEEEDKSFQEYLCRFPLGFLVIDTDKLNGVGSEFQEVVYCYPRPMKKNNLCNSKGIFLTLSHLLKDITRSSAKITSFIHYNTTCHVTYQKIRNHLLLLMLPDAFVKPSELIILLEDILRMFVFIWNTLEDGFGRNNLKNIDQFFSMFFGKTLKTEEFPTFESNSHHGIDAVSLCNHRSTDVFHVVQHIVLPKSAMIQVDDILTELEACDYREWNEEPLDCQRIFTVLGSAWFHYGYLVASHFMYDDVIDIYNFCKYQGISRLSRTELVKNILIWIEVFPHSSRNSNAVSTLLEARRYLLIVGCQKDLLAVILEAGGSTEPPKEGTRPDPFYVEEVQAALARIQEQGLSELADCSIGLNSGSRLTVPRDWNHKKEIDVLDISGSPKRQFREVHSTVSKQEIPLILKRRSNDQSRPVHAYSDSLSDDDYEAYSEQTVGKDSGNGQNKYGDAAILSRGDINGWDSEGSNDEKNTDSRLSDNSSEKYDIKQMFSSESMNIKPVSANCNVLHHYVQLENTKGILLMPSVCNLNNETRNIVISNFRKCFQLIHVLFQNAIRFKNMTTSEMTKSAVNKSLIAIKEHGIMFECPMLDQEDTKENKISFWVIGRLFSIPQVREIYICYNSAIPQNIVELAFKWNMESSG